MGLEIAFENGKYDAVEHLHGILRERFVLVSLRLTLYADESGIHDVTGKAKGAEVVAVVGYIATKKQWDNFTRRWNTALKKFGLDRPFHMHEFEDRPAPPPYDGWSKEKRNRFMAILTKIARENTWFAIGGMVVTKDYDAVLPEWLKAELKHPYHFCFQMLFDRLLASLKSLPAPGLAPLEQIACVFDRSDEFKADALQVYDNVKKERDSEDRLGGISFESKAKYVPLQAADLVVYEMRKLLTRAKYDLPLKRRPSEEALEGRHNMMVGFYDEKNLKIYAAEQSKRRLDLAIKMGVITEDELRKAYEDYKSSAGKN